MYLKTSVEIPKAKGRIITKNKGGSVYVLFQYGRKYIHEKRYSIPLRAVIGKLLPDQPGRMLPNERFQEYFPDIAVSDEQSDNARSCALKIGSYIAISKILDEYSLKSMLVSRTFATSSLAWSMH